MYTERGLQMRTLQKLITAVLVFMCIMPVSVMAEEPVTFDDVQAGLNDIIILYTNDVHGGVSNNGSLNGTNATCLGYAGLAAVRQDALEKAAGMILVDNGDSIQGSVIDTMTDGQASIDLMEQLPYDICIPGNHEFDFTVETFLEKAKASTLNYICANFTDMEGNLLLDKAYDIRSVEVAGREIKIAFVGLDTPASIAQGKPANFQDEEGNWKYTFNADTAEEFYGIIQRNIDEARAEAGEDCIVIVVGHLGDKSVDDHWTSQAVIANTEHVDVFLDGHAHSEIVRNIIKDKNGESVIQTSAGTKLDNIGCLKIHVADDGAYEFTCSLINSLTPEEKASDVYASMEKAVKDVEAEYEYLVEKAADSEFDLVINDPETGNRIVRNKECNMGDLITDAYLWYSEHPMEAVADKMVRADCAFLNGGSIRADISKGPITYMDILTVLPWYTHVTELKATGQQILDCLEMGARLYPEASGGFIQTSGLTYSIDPEKESKVITDEKMQFAGVDGTYEDGAYRVHNVKIGGIPIDLKKEYILVINNTYYKEGIDGMTMFTGCEALVDADDNVIDVEVVAKYMSEGLDGKIPEEYKDPYGRKRITEAEWIQPETEAEGNISMYILAAVFLGAVMYGVYHYLKKKE